MDEKKRAEELIEEFKKVVPICEGTGSEKEDIEQHLDTCKYCAIIACEIALGSAKAVVSMYHGSGLVNSNLEDQPEKYWNNVKKEIENYENENK